MWPELAWEVGMLGWDVGMLGCWFLWYIGLGCWVGMLGWGARLGCCVEFWMLGCCIGKFSFEMLGWDVGLRYWVGMLGWDFGFWDVGLGCCMGWDVGLGYSARMLCVVLGCGIGKLSFEMLGRGVGFGCWVRMLGWGVMGWDVGCWVGILGC